MANLSKDQIKQIIQSAPQGTSPAGIVAGLRAKGHVLEGYPDQSQQQSQLGFSSTISDPNLGLDIAKGFGKGLLRTATSGAELLGRATGFKPIGVDDQFKEGIKPKKVGEHIGYGLEKTAEMLAPIPGAAKANAIIDASRFAAKVPIVSGLLKTGAKTGIAYGEQALRTGLGTGDVSQANTEGKVSAGVTAAIPAAGAIFKGASKLLGSSKLGEVLTGVKAETWNKWKSIVSSDPEKAVQLRALVTESPDKPFLSLAEKVASRMKKMKSDAQDAWTVAKDAWRTTNADVSFDLKHSLPELNAPLGNFGLKATQLRDKAGQITGRISLQAKGSVTPFTTVQRGHIESLVKEVNNANKLTIDDLDTLVGKFDEAYNEVKLNPDGTPTKYHALVMQLKDKVSSYIEDILPKPLKDARSLYRDYYDVYDKVGNKLINSTGELKDTAQSYLANINNLNKGLQRKKLIEAGNKMGIDIFGASEDLKTAQQVVQTVPQTTKNRTMDFIRAIVGSKALGAGEGAGLFFAPHIALPALILNILSSPSMYSNTIEAIAGAGKKLPIQKVIQSLPKEEIEAIKRVLIHQWSQANND